jgi:hypothetical protein
MNTIGLNSTTWHLFIQVFFLQILDCRDITREINLVFFLFSIAVKQPVITREITLCVPSREDNDNLIRHLKKKWLPKVKYH